MQKKTSVTRGSVTSGGVSKSVEDTESSGKAGVSRMSIRQYNEVVIPLAVSAVIDGFDYDGVDAADLYGDGDY